VTGTNEQTIGRPSYRPGSFLRFCLCVALCAFVGWTGGIITAPQIPVWYASLAKPAWTPPNSVFPVAWSALYFLMAVTLWRLWDRVSPSSARTKAIVWFFIQLALNFVWTPVFFGWHAVPCRSHRARDHRASRCEPMRHDMARCESRSAGCPSAHSLFAVALLCDGVEPGHRADEPLNYVAVVSSLFRPPRSSMPPGP
jgi:TspO/MBR family